MKKFLSMLTALTLVITMFCACSTSEEKQPQDKNKPTINEPSSKEENKSIKDESTKDSVKEPVKEENGGIGGSYADLDIYLLKAQDIGYVRDIIGNDKMMQWANENSTKEHLGDARMKMDQYPDLYEIIHDLKIDKEAFIKENNKKIEIYKANNWDYKIYAFTDEEVEVLFGNDPKKAREIFLNDQSIISGDYAYSAYWIMKSSADDYKKAGITKAMLEPKVKLIKERYLTTKDSKYQAIMDKSKSELDAKFNSLK